MEFARYFHTAFAPPWRRRADRAHDLVERIVASTRISTVRSPSPSDHGAQRRDLRRGLRSIRLRPRRVTCDVQRYDRGESAGGLAHPARPRKIIRARFRRTMSSSASRPTRLPSFALGIVVTLSTISRETASSPSASLGATTRRNSGASVGSLVKAQIVIELVASNRSSWTITIGRGLPA